MKLPSLSASELRGQGHQFPQFLLLLLLLHFPAMVDLKCEPGEIPSPISCFFLIRASYHSNRKTNCDTLELSYSHAIEIL